MRRSIGDRMGSSPRAMPIFVVHGRDFRNGIARNHERSEQGLEKVLGEELLKQACGARINSVDHTERQHRLHSVGICEIEFLMIEPGLKADALSLALNELLLGKVLQKLAQQCRVWVTAHVHAALLEAGSVPQMGYRVVN